MQTVYIRIAILCVFLYSARADVRECGEIGGEKLTFEGYKKQNELEQYFDALNENDSKRMGDIFKIIGNAEIDEPKYVSYANVIKFVPDRIKSEGYPAEVHEVITDDGYILQLHRIPYGKKSPQTDKPRPPVFLMHPFLESSNAWIVSGPDHSLAYLLADAGYDVWMGNARGAEVSRRHVRLRPTGWNQKKYWSFSWHEVGVYDLPACIDFILSNTSHTNLNYIGYSQGSTSFFVMMSERPEYNNKIIEAQLMAPVASLKGVNTPFLNAITRNYKLLKRTFEIARVYKITTSNKLGVKIAEWACSKAVSSTPASCKIVLAIIDSNQLNCSSLPSILVNTPAGGSIKQLLHYIQLIRSGGFNQFDYDNEKMNRKIYGTKTPPAYNLTQVTVPVNIYHSRDDSMSTLQNVLELESKLQNVKSRYMIPINDFRHVDFTYSRYVRKAVNDQIISNINKANGK